MPMANEQLKSPRILFRTPAGLVGIVTPLTGGKPYLFTFQGYVVRRLGVLNSLADATRLAELLSAALPEAMADPAATEAYAKSALVHPI